jgi:hypothetical protein
VRNELCRTHSLCWMFRYRDCAFSRAPDWNHPVRWSAGLDAHSANASMGLYVGALLLRRCLVADHSRRTEFLRTSRFRSRDRGPLDRLVAAARASLVPRVDERSTATLVAGASRPHVVGVASTGPDRLGFSTDIGRVLVPRNVLVRPDWLRTGDRCSGVAPEAGNRRLGTSRSASTFPSCLPGMRRRSPAGKASIRISV